MGRGVNTGALSPVGGIGEIRMRANLRKIVAFAAFVVDNMRKQNMLKEDKIAELLKDNPNEK